MQRTWTSSGSASQFALVSLLAVIIISTGLFILIAGMHRITVLERSRVALNAGFLEMLDNVVAEMTPETGDKADSYFDLYQKDYLYNDEKDALIRSVDGFAVSVRDYSGKIPINMINTDLLFKTSLKSCFAPGVTEYTVKDFRSGHGLVLDPEVFAGLFDNEDDAALFSVYGYANFNTSSEDALAFVGEVRSGNAAIGESIRSVARQFRSQMIIADKADFKSQVKMRYPDMYPLINIEPVFNINFAAEKIIKAVCSYPYGEHPIPNNQAMAAALIALRNEREIIPNDLETMIRTEKDYPAQKRIFQYLGTTSWFRGIEIEKDGYAATALLVRLPENDFGETQFRIAEYRVEKE
ncbi:MAG: hypothetical protein JW874_09060 [Spirochaetales bacterium]|nr:hypothetical protein [Spirochaetales bacterium]